MLTRLIKYVNKRAIVLQFIQLNLKLIQFDTKQNNITMIKLHVSIPITYLEIIHFPCSTNMYGRKILYMSFTYKMKYLNMRVDYVDMRGTLFVLKYDLSTVMVML